MSKSGRTMATALILLFAIATNCAAEYSGGLGTPAEPYEIGTAADWQDLMDTPTDWDKHFILTADLNLEGLSLSPVGDYYDHFTGVFDGNSYVIRNVDIDMPSTYRVGLFGYVGSDAQIHNIRIEDVVIRGSRYVGGLVGNNTGGSVINCYASGSISGRGRYVGGLVGRSAYKARISKCYVVGSVRGDYHVGGLVGENHGGNISNCYVVGSVSGDSYVGGLAGENTGGNINNCYSTGSVSGDGGVGGLVGLNDGGTIGNCYAVGPVTGGSWLGGLVGYNWGSIENSYFLHPDNGGGPDNGWGTPLTNAEMQHMSSSMGWDFVGRSIDGTSEIWQMPASGDYPVLSIFQGYEPPALAGAGTPDDPYLISDPNELGAMYHYDQAACYRLTADIDLSGIYWSMPPIPVFHGTFEGNGRTIRNLDVSMPAGRYVGLFGYISSGANIRDVGVENAEIAGEDDVGGLVGHNKGAISNCYATGSVSGDYDVGGLAGLSNRGSISNCCAAGSVNGDRNVGGLTGYNFDGGIKNSYSTGSVSGRYSVGGLVGSDERGVISNCYSTVSVVGDSSVGGLLGHDDNGNIAACFWDIEISGQSGSPRGKGLTTAQMKSATIYRNAGWAGKGWVIEDGLDYPRLAWEGTPGVPIPEPEPVALLGSGTEEDPYQIWTADDFALLSRHICVLDKYIEVMADLDLDGMPLYAIGNLGPFAGIFDGNDHIIRNADINMPGSYRVGLFGQVGLGGEIRNIGLKDAVIAGDYYVGGLVGYNGKGDITNCDAIALVGGYGYIGDLVGYNDGGSVTDCCAAGPVNATDDYVGGLVGYNDGGSISNCYAAASVIGGGYYVGGLAGYNLYGGINNSYSTCSVNGRYSVGGLVGKGEKGTIANCHASGSVIGNSCLGGLIGYNQYGSIVNCYATGSVEGGEYAGGLVGSSGEGIISNCYATGSVSGTHSVGGLLGGNRGGNISIAYFLRRDDGGGPNNGFGSPLTDAQMRRQNSFAGWDFVGRSRDGTSEVWQMPAGGGYPVLSTFHGYSPPILAGAGTPDDPYLLSDSSGLGAMYHYDETACYRLTADIGLLGIHWSTPVIPVFRGSFDGNGHIICNVDVNSPNGGYVGLFGYLSPVAHIRNVGLRDASISGGDNVGGLVGYNAGNVSNCYSTGLVGGDGRVGGLVGCMCMDDAGITNCYTAVSVSGSYSASGLVGGICDPVGGREPFSSRVSSAYFLGPDDGGGPEYIFGQPLTDVQMRQEGSYVGWDFVGEEDNGTEDIWTICEGTNYPRFVRQIPSADWLCPDGVGLEDFGHFGGFWGTAEGGAVNLDDEDGIGFGDLMIFCREWLNGR